MIVTTPGYGIALQLVHCPNVELKCTLNFAEFYRWCKRRYTREKGDTKGGRRSVRKGADSDRVSQNESRWLPEDSQEA
jgi:hypothetical protein